MIRLSPIRRLRETMSGIAAAVSAAREYHDAAALRQGTGRPGNPLTAGIPL